MSGFQGADADIYKMGCAEFRQHLAAIAQCLRTPPITARELITGVPQERPMLLTFDDGGASALQYIADMLDECGWKAHFLVTAGRIGTVGFRSWPDPGTATTRDRNRKSLLLTPDAHG